MFNEKSDFTNKQANTVTLTLLRERVVTHIASCVEMERVGGVCVCVCVCV